MALLILKKTDYPLLGRRFKYNPHFINHNISPLALKSHARIKAKIRKGLYKFQKSPCFCGSEDSILLAQMDSYGNYYPLVLCKKCGLMRAEPRLTKETYIDFYTHEYQTLHGFKEEDKDELWRIKMNKAKNIHTFINSHIKLPRKAVVFDIGCFMGTMLLPFYKNGHEVMGVDYGIDTIEYGRRKFGLNLEVGSVEKLKDFGKKADLIILNHVLEHLMDLEEELKNIWDIMKHNCYMFIAVPGTFWIHNLNRGNIMSRLQNAHLWQFSLNSLRYVMECCGFELVYGDEEIKSIFKVCNTFRDKKDIPKNECVKVITYLKRTERKYLPQFYAIRLLELFGVKEKAKSVILKYFPSVKR